MRGTYIYDDGRDQSTKTPFIESDTSPVSLGEQKTSSKESKPSSSGELYAMVQVTLETSLIIVGLVLIIVLLPHRTANDGTIRYHDLLRLLSTHNLFDPHSKYSLIGLLFSVPLLLIGEQLGHPGEWICFYNVTLFCLCLLLSYLLLRNYIDRALLRKFFLVLIYGSMFVGNLSFYYGEVFTALCVGFGVLVAFRRSTRITGWVAVTLGVASNPATVIGLGLLVLKRTVDSKRLRYLLVFVAAVLCILIEFSMRIH